MAASMDEQMNNFYNASSLEKALRKPDHTSTISEHDKFIGSIRDMGAEYLFHGFLPTHRSV
jgi:hypothetical protein